MFSKPISLVLALALGSTGAALAQDKGHHHGAHAADPTAAATALTGEVMDLVCFMQHPESGQGPDHANCARQCIQKGLPAGLKVGSQLYLLMAKGHGSIVDQVAEHAGKQATVTGKVIDRDGMKALIVESIKPAG